jgi:hypothetical protein
MKQCSRCGLTKPMTEYYADPRAYDRKVAACNACCSARQMKIFYGITPREYAEQIERQAGGCAICGGVTEKKLRTAQHRNLVVDHNQRCCGGHRNRTCGACRRALLCDRCNRGLGFFVDDPWLLTIAATYVESHMASVSP